MHKTTQKHKQPQQWQQQQCHKFAYWKNNGFACSAHAIFIFVPFTDILVLYTTWNDLFCSCVDDLSTWWQMFNLVFLSQKQRFQFNSRIVGTYFASVMTLNKYWEIIAATPSYIFIYIILLPFKCKVIGLNILTLCSSRFIFSNSSPHSHFTYKAKKLIPQGMWNNYYWQGTLYEDQTMMLWGIRPAHLEIVFGFINNNYCYLKNKCSEKVSLSKDGLKVKPLWTFTDLKTLLKIIECPLCITGFVPFFWLKIQGLFKDFQGHIFHISRTPCTVKSIGIMIVFTCFLLLRVATFLPVAYIFT